ncbi:hypothetical protein Mp_8g14980 [Marchantia polymorpha subsp. ruderalis]|uniref:Uncharacterized protein n=1 Tax=Marchantia polymorpha TaxID=3197 RepID=A0A2R6W513_MARPO|nr:hypothetical protein MARPO_0151s0008 [Marchantia polymorpha]BBN19933.1 hypothetical protein Mp_8g14980 [Marchantia polymorpha subsp. ruderalis]|eukprot:PTQ28931.1 hypothetical protein MARPO_0151s0008 [Marchantia polymorpha]
MIIDRRNPWGTESPSCHDIGSPHAAAIPAHCELLASLSLSIRPPPRSTPSATNRQGRFFAAGVGRAHITTSPWRASIGGTDFFLVVVSNRRSVESIEAIDSGSHQALIRRYISVDPSNPRLQSQQRQRSTAAENRLVATELRAAAEPEEERSADELASSNVTSRPDPSAAHSPIATTDDDDDDLRIPKFPQQPPPPPPPPCNPNSRSCTIIMRITSNPSSSSSSSSSIDDQIRLSRLKIATEIRCDSSQSLPRAPLNSSTSSSRIAPHRLNPPPSPSPSPFRRPWFPSAWEVGSTLAPGPTTLVLVPEPPALGFSDSPGGRRGPRAGSRARGGFRAVEEDEERESDGGWGFGGLTKKGFVVVHAAASSSSSSSCSFSFPLVVVGRDCCKKKRRRC